LRRARVVTSALGALAAVATLAGCRGGPVPGPVVVEALVASLDDPRSFALDDVVLERVTDLRSGEGELFDVRRGFAINSDTLITQLRDEQLGFAELAERGRAAGRGPVAPRMSFDGARWIAEDFDTLQYFTLWHHFERAWAFARDDLGDESGATTQRSLVAMYGDLALSELLPLPVRSADNTAYVVLIDGWLNFRAVLLNEGVPFAMNPGVVAHELHHRVFFHNVFGGDAFENWRAWAVGGGSQRAGNLVRGLDEGLADVFAVAFTGDPSFMSPSLAGRFDTQAQRRDLDGELAQAVSYEALRDALLPVELQNHCGFSPDLEDQLAAPQLNVYCVGTALARALWEGADFDVEVLRRDVLPAVNRALPEVGRTIAARSGSNELVFDLDVFLQESAERLPDDVRGAVCDAYRARFATFFEPRDGLPAAVTACD
jgi:hypothetical protein